MAKKTTAVDFLGLGNNPSDIDSKDGNLALAINVHHDNGAITPAFQDAPRAFEHNNALAIYQHLVAGEKTSHLIFRKVETVYTPSGNINVTWYYYLNKTEDDIIVPEISDKDAWNAIRFNELLDKDVKNVISIGNTVLFYTEDKVYYYLWKSNSYIFLGNEIPEVNMRFELEAHPYYYSAEEFKDRSSYGYFPTQSSYRIYTPNSFIDGSHTHTDYDDEDTEGETSTRYSQNRPGGSGNAEFDKEYSTFSPKDEAAVTDGVFGLVNKFTGDWCNEKGYFSQPFFVRFALRLFDGTYTKHSSPILMMPTTGSNPVVPITYSYFTNVAEPESEDNEGESSSMKDSNYFEIDCWGIGSELFYYLENIQSSLSNWKDIIKGVDIFISAPIYTYTQEPVRRFVIPSFGYDFFGDYSKNGTRDVRYFYSNPIPLEHKTSGDSAITNRMEKIWNYINPSSDSGFAASDFKLLGSKHQYLALTINGQDRLIAEAKNRHFSSFPNTSVIKEEGVPRVTSTYPVAYVNLPEKSYDKFDREVIDCSNFYLLKSYNLSELTYNGRAKVDIEPGSLASIVTRQPLDDDLDSHHLLIPNVVRSYNNRLNMASLKRKLFNGYSPLSMLQKIDGDAYVDKPIKAIAIYINKDGKDIVVVNNDKVEFDLIEVPYIYYPDPNAFKVTVFYGYSTDDKYNCLTYPMREHKGLNGSVAYIGLERIKKNGADIHIPARDYIPTPSNEFMPYPNLLYTSEVANPFKFKAANVEQVGQGEILALVPQAVAMSQGQFGQFPMICFTTDGVWALSVNNTGGWSAKQPFSRDVLLSPDAFLQMDREILFTTQRGVMGISGSAVDCLTEIFDGKLDLFLNGIAFSQQFNADWKSVLKAKVFPKIWSKEDALYKDIDFFAEFKKFIKNGIYLYDYTHQRVIIGNKNYSFSFVLNLKDKMWTSIPMKILSSVNSYPQCFANVYNEYTGQIYLADFADTTTNLAKQPKNGILLTRPIKLSSPTVQKTIRTINLQGQFDKNNTSMILLGCNDNAMKDWFVVSSCEGSRLPFRYGTPFKYFRVIVVTKLDAGESLSGMMIEYEYKELNKERQ